MGRMSPVELTAALKSHALALGFGLVGVAPAVDARGAARLGEWLDRGYAGEMQYLARPARGVRPSAACARRSAQRRDAGAALPHGRAGAGRSGAGESRPLRVGDGRLSRSSFASELHDLADHLRATCADGDDARGGRHGAAAGAGVRAARRPGLGRQEHAAAQPRRGELLLPGGAADRRGTGVRRAA